LPQEISRLESFVIRLETDGSVWNRFQTVNGIWFSRTLFIFERKLQEKYGFYAGISKL
jgi:hypothetical protein